MLTGYGLTAARKHGRPGREARPRTTTVDIHSHVSVPAAAAFVEAVGGRANPKFGWTDVARFSGLGIPAVNFGPGDPHLAHKQDEFVPLDQVVTVERQLRSWLGADA